MMLIPPPLNLGTTTTNSAVPKDKYFSPSGIYPSNPIHATPGSTDLSPDSGGNRVLYKSPPVDGRLYAPKMQSDLPGFHMHAAAAVVTGHPGSFPLNSPASYAAGAAGAPSHSLVPAHYGSTAIDPASYYSPLGPGYDMKGGDMWSGSYNQPAHTYYQYDTGFGPQYPYDRCYAMDMNDGVRRKNATRESTNTLKSWLQEHKKNPYPTKGEKIMLAIITKMTLTQVSTWFANARRRLKKENKMTWVPKNRANESGSGTEERRQSDDKDSDEKSDDEDCKSDKDEENEASSETKADPDPEANASSCQYSQSNPVPMSFTQTPNDAADPCPPDAAETVDAKPEYGRMMGGDIPYGSANMSNADASLSDKIHNANMLQDAAPARRYEAGHDGYNRSIWSPVDSQKSARPYPIYGADYHSQAAYHVEADGRRLSSSHPHSYTGTNYDAASLSHMSIAHRSQEGLALHSHPKMFSPMSNEAPNKATNGPADSERGEYTYTSPVTDLRNYVNGVFHGPPQQVPGAGMCEKSAAMKDKSPNPSGDAVLSPGDPVTYYPHHRYDQSYLHHRQGLPAEGNMSSDSFMLHRSISAPYSAYYNDGISCYPSHGASESMGAYYGHRSNSSSHGIVGESAPADPTRPNNSSGQDAFTASRSASQQHCQGSPTADGVTDHRSSACMAYYENSIGGSVPRSSVPPPPYASQAQTQAYLATPMHLSHRPSYDGMNPGSNHSASSHSPRALQPGVQSHEGGNFGCGVTSDEEEMRKMQSGERVTDKASR